MSRGSYWSLIEKIAKETGVRISSGTRSPEENARVGGAKGSGHLSGYSRDYVGTPEQKSKFFARAIKELPSGVVRELFYDPSGSYTHKPDKKQGPRKGKAIGDHSDHVHITLNADDIVSRTIGNIDKETRAIIGNIRSAGARERAKNQALEKKLDEAIKKRQTGVSSSVSPETLKALDKVIKEYRSRPTKENTGSTVGDDDPPSQDELDDDTVRVDHRTGKLVPAGDVQKDPGDFGIPGMLFSLIFPNTSTSYSEAARGFTGGTELPRDKAEKALAEIEPYFERFYREQIGNIEHAASQNDEGPLTQAIGRFDPKNKQAMDRLAGQARDAISNADKWLARNKITPSPEAKQLLREKAAARFAGNVGNASIVSSTILDAGTLGLAGIAGAGVGAAARAGARMLPAGAKAAIGKVLNTPVKRGIATGAISGFGEGIAESGIAEGTRGIARPGEKTGPGETAARVLGGGALGAVLGGGLGAVSSKLDAWIADKKIEKARNTPPDFILDTQPSAAPASMVQQQQITPEVPVPDVPVPVVPIPPVPDVTVPPVPTVPGVTVPPVPDTVVPRVPGVTTPPVTNIPVPTVPDVMVPPVSDIPAPRVPDVTVPPVTNIPVPTVPDVTVPPVSDIPVPRVPDIDIPNVGTRNAVAPPVIPDVQTLPPPGGPDPTVPDIPQQVVDTPTAAVPDIVNTQVADTPGVVPDVDGAVQDTPDFILDGDTTPDLSRNVSPDTLVNPDAIGTGPVEDYINPSDGVEHMIGTYATEVGVPPPPGKDPVTLEAARTGVLGSIEDAFDMTVTRRKPRNSQYGGELDGRNAFIRFSRDIGTTLHEVAHHLVNNDQLITRHLSEAFRRPRAGTVDDFELDIEDIANHFAMMVIGDHSRIRRTNKTDAMIAAFTQLTPAQRNALRNVRRFVADFTGSDALTKIGSTMEEIDVRRKPVRVTREDFIRSLQNIRDWFVEGFSDDATIFTRLSKVPGAKWSPIGNPDYIRQILSSPITRAYQFMKTGIPDGPFLLTSSTPSIDDIVAAVKGKDVFDSADRMNNAHRYMVAKKRVGMVQEWEDRLIQARDDLQKAIEDDLDEATIMYLEKAVHKAKARIDDLKSSVHIQATLGIEGDYKVLAEAVHMVENNPEMFAYIQDYSNKYNDYAKGLLSYAYSAGVITDNAFRNMLKFDYVDMHRIMDDKVVRSLAKSGPGARTVGSEDVFSERQYGSDLIVGNPLANLMRQTERIVAKTDENILMLSIIDSLSGLDDVPRTPDNPNPPRTSDYFVKVSRPSALEKSKLWAVKRRGNVEYYKFNDEIAGALDMWRRALPPKMHSGLMRMYKSTIVYWPKFIKNQLFRDTIDRFVRGGSSSKSLSPLRFVDLFNVSKDDIAELGYAGALDGGHYTMTEEQLNKSLVQKIREMHNDPGVVTVIPRWIDTWKNMAHGAEALNRSAEFKRAKAEALAAGWDEQNANVLAALSSKALLNLSVAGKFVRYMDAYWSPFNNANIQGLKNTFAGLKANPAGAALNYAAYVGAPVILQHEWNKQMGAEKEYAELPAWRRYLFYNIRIPGTLTFAAIPKPHGLALLSMPLEAAVHSGYNPDGAPPVSSLPFLKVMNQEFFPFDEGSFLPVVAKGAVEAMNNYSIFRARNIIPPNDVGVPLEFRKGTYRAGPIPKAISGVATEVAKLLDAGLGVRIDTDPRIIEHIGNSYTGYMGPAISALSKSKSDTAISLVFEKVFGLTSEQDIWGSESVQSLFRTAKDQARPQDRRVREVVNLLIKAEGEAGNKQMSTLRRAWSLSRRYEQEMVREGPARRAQLRTRMRESQHR